MSINSKKPRNKLVMLPLTNLRHTGPHLTRIDSHNTPEKLDALLEDALDECTEDDFGGFTVRNYIESSSNVKLRDLALKRAKRRMFDINFINNGRICGRMHVTKLLEPDHLGNEPYTDYLETGVAIYEEQNEVLYPHFSDKPVISNNPFVPSYGISDCESVFYDLVTSCCVGLMKATHQGNSITAIPVVPPGVFNTHQPVIDLDIPAKLLPSFQEGHSHLYLDKKMTWRNYLKLLKVMSEVGIIEKEYYEVSKQKGYTAVRSPCDMIVYPFEEEYASSSMFTAGLNPEDTPKMDKSEAEYLQDQIDFLAAENEKLRERLDKLSNVARR